MTSTHKAEVVEVNLTKHPNADSLSIVKIYGFQVVVRTEDWIGKSLGVYIQPDSIVPDLPEYAFLGSEPRHRRIGVKKLRGEISEGLLMPLPANGAGFNSVFNVGDDMAQFLNITHWNPPEPQASQSGSAGSGRALSASPKNIPEYEVDSWHRYGAALFVDGEPVVITEKIDGTNFRMVFQDGKFWVGSHRTWRGEFVKPWNWKIRFLEWLGFRKSKPTNDLYWKTARKYPGLFEFCKSNPDCVVYGEVFGKGVLNGCKKLNYLDREPELIVFDILSADRHWFLFEIMRKAMIRAGVLASNPTYGNYSEALIKSFMSGKSWFGAHTKEGIVIRSTGVPRRQLKACSPEYYELKGKH